MRFSAHFQSTGHGCHRRPCPDRMRRRRRRCGTVPARLPATRTRSSPRTAMNRQHPLMPADTSEVYGGRVVELLFEGLRSYDASGKSVNALAESIESPGRPELHHQGEVRAASSPTARP